MCQADNYTKATVPTVHVAEWHRTHLLAPLSIMHATCIAHYTHAAFQSTHMFMFDTVISCRRAKVSEQADLNTTAPSPAGFL